MGLNGKSSKVFAVDVKNLTVLPPVATVHPHFVDVDKIFQYNMMNAKGKTAQLLNPVPGVPPGKSKKERREI